MFRRKGLVATVIAGVLAAGASAIPRSLATADDGRPPVRTAIYRVEQPAAGERLTTEPTPAVGESQSPATGVLKAALERWRGGGGGLPVTTAIYRVERPAPGESSFPEPTSIDDEPEATGTDVTFDLVRWRRGWGWGWGRGWGWGYRGFGWRGYRRFAWGGYPGWGGYGFYGRRFYRPFYYRPYVYGGFGYPGYGYAYRGFGFGGYPIAYGGYGGYGYPLYGAYW
jgi:hypothetical protein